MKVIKVIDVINILDSKRDEIIQKYCDHCQEFTCDDCNIEMDDDAK